MVSSFDSGKKKQMLKACQICGKQPKVKITTWYDRGNRKLIEIRCKPFLRKEHIAIKWCASENWIHMRDAVRYWNERVKYVENIKGR